MKTSRHDQIIITIAAYVIGFTTAFIAFGIGKVYAPETTQTNAFDFHADTANAQIGDGQISLSLDADGLRLHTPTDDRLLSINRSAQYAANVLGSIASTSLYYHMIDAELSRDKRFAYFCQQMKENDTTCDPYLYDVANDVIHPVMIENEKTHFSIATHTLSWTPDGRLVVEQYVSVDPSQPWYLVTR